MSVPKDSPCTEKVGLISLSLSSCWRILIIDLIFQKMPLQLLFSDTSIAIYSFIRLYSLLTPFSPLLFPLVPLAPFSPCWPPLAPCCLLLSPLVPFAPFFKDAQRPTAFIKGPQRPQRKIQLKKLLKTGNSVNSKTITLDFSIYVLVIISTFIILSFFLKMV